MALVEAAKAKLREHFRVREAERSGGKIQEWKEAKIYPYEGKASDPIGINERQVFDVVALNLADYSPQAGLCSASSAPQIDLTAPTAFESRTLLVNDCNGFGERQLSAKAGR